MNNLFKYTLTLILCGFFVSSFAQLNSGTIKFEITEVSAQDAAMEAQLQMLKGGTTTIYFDKSNQRTDVEMMGGMVTYKVIVNPDKSSYSLMDMMGQKFKVVTSAEEAMKAAEAAGATPDVKHDKSDTKEILGYKCSKATITLMGMEMDVYYTKEIKTPSSVVGEVKTLELDGTPLEYVINNMGMKITSTAKEISKDALAKDIFKPSSEGYKEMTQEEFQKQMGGAAGGLGF